MRLVLFLPERREKHSINMKRLTPDRPHINILSEELLDSEQTTGTFFKQHKGILSCTIGDRYLASFDSMHPTAGQDALRGTYMKLMPSRFRSKRSSKRHEHWLKD